RRARLDDPRPGLAVCALAVAGAKAGCDRSGYLRRTRRRRKRSVDFRERLRGEPDRQPGEHATGAADADLGAGGLRRFELRRAPADAGATVQRFPPTGAARMPAETGIAAARESRDLRQPA